MKNKKGFTLIELLAVIVILAIIALIATPIVLNIIKDSKDSSTLQSAEFYVDAVEHSLARKMLDGTSVDDGMYKVMKDGNLCLLLENGECKKGLIKIDINGEVPTEGKILINKNEFKSAMLKCSDSKILKYENNKIIESDEKTYISFASYIVNEDLEFTYDEQQSAYFAYLTITKDIADKFQVGMDYDYIIDDGKAITLTANNTPALGGMALYFANINDSSNGNIVLISDEKLTFASFPELTGIHNIKIGNVRPIQDSMFFMIEPDGDIAITSYNFISDSADILIKDEDGTEYFNDTVELMMNDKSEGDGMIGASTGCRNNISELPSVYSAISEGKTITIEVRQIVNGKEIVSTISKNLDSVIYSSNDYLSSGHLMAAMSLSGC